MPHCDKCGAEIGEGEKFCSKCGAYLVERRRIREERRGPREECFGRREEGDNVGLISFGIFLLIFGFVWYMYPEILSDIKDLFVRLTEEQVFEPSTSLIKAFTLLLGLLGVSNFAVAGLRVALKQPLRRPLSDVLSGVFLISFAYLVSLYGKDVLTLEVVLLLVLLTAGLLVIGYGVIKYIIKKI